VNVAKERALAEGPEKAAASVTQLPVSTPSEEDKAARSA
jgi:hypothetical protein